METLCIEKMITHPHTNHIFQFVIMASIVPTFAPMPRPGRGGGNWKTDLFLLAAGFGVFRLLFAAFESNEPEFEWFPYPYSTRFYCLHLKPNNTMVHDIENRNIDCLKRRGYSIIIPNRSYTGYKETCATIFNENESIEQFLKDCKECNVYSELRYSEFGRYMFDHTVKLKWHNAVLR